MSVLLACPAGYSEWPEHGGFDDHSFGRLEQLEDFHAHARSASTGAAALKFVIVDFEREGREQVRYLDGQFYEFHDQWYWFRLVNGHEVPGARVRPLGGHAFGEVEEVIDWYRERLPLVLDLSLLDDGRLYSQRFYDIAVHRDSRRLGIGTLVHLPASEQRDALWGFELEYGDEVDAETLARFFALLRASVPPELAEQLRFIARSPAQTRLVAELREAGDPLAEHLSSYAELARPGEIEVYNHGLIAGRLRKLPSDPQLAAAALTTGDPRAIWVLPVVPDELPPAAGLITAVPQTPLAHVNLLARDRGIPNLYLGGAMEDPQLDQLARIHAPVVLLATADGELQLEAIDSRDYARWRALQRRRGASIAPLELDTLPYTLELSTQALASMPQLRRSVGGKAAGFVALARAGVAMPERPLAISVRAYAEHIAPLRPLLEDLLHDPVFAREPRARYLLLEGPKDFAERFPSARDQAWREDFERHPRVKRGPIAELLARGGVKRALRDQPLDPELARTLEEALRAHFGHFAPTQGLRFRSSSSVEDIEGFSGAGLYDSNTGYLDPEAAGVPKKSVAWALRKTWASYWSWEAFEERRMAGIDHLAGHMGVLVHARFDDPLELANGVATLTLRRNAQGAPTLELLVDVQEGALSVTNPPPELAGEALPEVDRVRRQRGRAQIERLDASTVHPAPILSDDELLGLLESTTAVAQGWLDAEALKLSPAQARRRVNLDFEFRVVAQDWPAYTDTRRHASRPARRVVLKQARSLDPGVPPGARELVPEPIPRELLDHASRIERRRCSGARTTLELLEVWTDPMQPELGYASEPFLARVRLEHQEVEQLRALPARLELDHLALAPPSHPGLATGSPWALQVETLASTPLHGLEQRGGLLRIDLDDGSSFEEAAPCELELLYAAPEVFLRSLLED